jgi:putative ABC transport system permease protein
VYLNAVDAAYFSTLRIPIVRGRPFSDADVRGSALVAVVNQTLARNVWGSGDPIGQKIRLHPAQVERLQVVGVARDSKYDEPTEDPRPLLYRALAQRSAFDTDTLIVRTASVAPGAIERTIHAVDPALPVFDVRPFDVVVRDRADKQRAMSALFAGFGALALLLAAIGLYGVVAFTTAQRTRGMGLRLALGATPAQLTRLIAGDGLRLALIGSAIGAGLAVPLARVIGALIFGIEIADMAAFAVACTIMVAVAVLASSLPASRASVDPMAALRSE